MNPQYPEPAVSVCFGVTIDDKRLGAFNSCEGLGLEIVLEQREEGGQNGFIWQLPTRIKYTNIKLTRPLCQDTTEVMAWLASMTSGVKPSTGSITAMTAALKPVAQWKLDGVIPVKWNGPGLNLDSPKVAMETLEIAHHGFKAERVA
jgi:phage tail-like protein